MTAASPFPTPLTDHPTGCIRLGHVPATGAPVDVGLNELAQHVFLPGASGTGKTTTLTRLADGMLAGGDCGLVVIDCKGGDLRDMAARLARRYHLDWYPVDPEAEPGRTFGYDLCAGSPADVANKLVGAFEYAGAAQVYQHAAMQALPVLVRALRATGEPVTLDSLYRTLGGKAITKLSVALAHTDKAASDELAVLQETGDAVGRAGYAGLRLRFGALREGKFGPLFRLQPALDWEQVLSRSTVTYLSLPATAASEDVDLVGRVIAQDLKQVCGRRLRSQRQARGSPQQVLIIFDEFAALGEANQLVDFLLQARQARMPTVIATQYLPETLPLRKACLGAGLILAHRVESDDAQALAAQWGTRTTTEITRQLDFQTGAATKGSTRRVEEYRLHPNTLRELPTGRVAVRRTSNLATATVVQVSKDPEAL